MEAAKLLPPTFDALVKTDKTLPSYFPAQNSTGFG